MFNISPGQRPKRQKVIGDETDLDSVGPSHSASSSSKDWRQISQLGKYEMVHDESGEAVIKLVPQHDGDGGDATADGIASEAGSSA